MVRAGWCLLAVAGTVCGAPSRPIEYGRVEKVAEVSSRAVRESSGLATSSRRADLFWTHNDSGNRALLFGFDGTGALAGRLRLKGAGLYDWEDMAAFRYRGRPLLLVADVGNNRRSRSTGVLYLAEEPPPEALDSERVVEVPLAAAMRFRYPDGKYDCEAVAVDGTRGEIYLFTKTLMKSCRIYRLPLTAVSGEVATAEFVAETGLRLVTGADISRDGLRMVLLTYGGAHQYVRGERQPWEHVLVRAPLAVTIPGAGMREAVCYGPDGVTIYFTTEGGPAPLYRIVPLGGE